MPSRKIKTGRTNHTGLAIYAPFKRHRSMNVLPEFVLCSHICADCRKKWTHQCDPELACHLTIFSTCEECLTYSFWIDNEAKYEHAPESQKRIIAEGQRLGTAKPFRKKEK